jgi:hypothetical protein
MKHLITAVIAGICIFIMGWFAVVYSGLPMTVTITDATGIEPRTIMVERIIVPYFGTYVIGGNEVWVKIDRRRN